MTLLVVVYVALLLASFGLVMASTRATREDKLVASRITDLRNPRRSISTAEEESDLNEAKDHTLSEALGLFLLRFRFSTIVQALLLQSRSKWTLGMFALLSCGWAASGFAGGYLCFHSFGLALAAGGLGVMLPYFWLRRKRNKRLNDFGKALPDAVDLMARALQAGHSIQQTLELIAEQSPAPLRDEFAEVHQHQKFGIPFREALIQMSERLPSKDLRFVVTAILVQKETGGDLIEILERTAAVIRDRVRVEGEIKTYTAQGRLTGWILSLMPVVLLAVISLASPSYTHILFADVWGQRLLMAGGVMIVLGGLIIRKIVDVEM